MSLEPDELVAGLRGHIWRAPVGTAFPTNASTAVDETLWTELGYTSVEGPTFTFSRTSERIMGWQSREALRILTTEEPKSIAATFLQWNQNVHATAIGGGTWTEPSPGNFEFAPPDEDFVDEFAYIIEFEDDGDIFRFCFRRVQNTSGVEFSVTRTDVLRFPITVDVLAAPNGAKPYLIQTTFESLGDPTQAGS